MRPFAKLSGLALALMSTSRAFQSLMVRGKNELEWY